MNIYEIQILDWIQLHLSCDFMNTVMPFITRLGNKGKIWIFLALLLLIIPKTRKLGISISIALAAELFCCNVILKPLVARTRPYVVNPAVELLIHAPKDYSFPSGHTGASFAAVGALFFQKSKLWIPAAVLAALIGFSRLYLYVHFPTDVLSGAVLGILTGKFAEWILNRIAKMREGKT